MSTNYPTIQQHQPLRVPTGWGQQEKALILQIDEIFDDIYKRFGRLRIEDMGKEFRQRIEDDEGNYAEISETVDQLSLTVADKYDKRSGIDITVNGVDISGSKHVKITSGQSVWQLSDSGLEYKLNGTTGLSITATGFVVNAGNITLNSGHDLKAGNWTFNNSGLKYTNGNDTFTVEIFSSSFQAISLKSKYNVCLFPDNGTDGGIVITTYYYSNLYPSMVCLSGVNGSGGLSGGNVCLGTQESFIKFAFIDTLYQASSRERKTNIRSMERYGDLIDKLEPVTFQYKDDRAGDTRHGLIYEDAIKVLPEICSPADSAVKSINYLELVPILLKEIQELRERVKKLEGV